MDFDSENEMFYQEVLDRIVVYSGNIVIVYLNCVPFVVKLHYHSFGRMDKCSIEIDEMEVVDVR